MIMNQKYSKQNFKYIKYIYFYNFILLYFSAMIKSKNLKQKVPQVLALDSLDCKKSISVNCTLKLIG